MIVEFNKRIFSCQCNHLWGQNEQNRPLYLSISTNKPLSDEIKFRVASEFKESALIIKESKECVKKNIRTTNFE